jgi:hypothetical protein
MPFGLQNCELNKSLFVISSLCQVFCHGDTKLTNTAACTTLLAFDDWKFAPSGHSRSNPTSLLCTGQHFRCLQTVSLSSVGLPCSRVPVFSELLVEPHFKHEQNRAGCSHLACVMSLMKLLHSKGVMMSSSLKNQPLLVLLSIGPVSPGKGCCRIW